MPRRRTGLQNVELLCSSCGRPTRDYSVIDVVLALPDGGRTISLVFVCYACVVEGKKKGSIRVDVGSVSTNETSGEICGSA